MSKIFRKIVLSVLTAVILTSLSFSLSSCKNGSSANAGTNNGSTTEPTKKPSVIDIADNAITITTNRLKLDVCQPGKEYTGTRFDYGAIIKMVTLDGKHTFGSTEKDTYEYDPKLGFGMMADMDAVIVANPAEKAYEVTSDGNSVIFTLDQPGDSKGKSYKVVKTLTAEGNKLTIKCVVTNNGSAAFTFSEYNHDFTIIDRKPTGPDYELKFSFTPQFIGTPEKGKDLLSLNGDSITWSRQLEKADEFICLLRGYEKGKKDYSWTLTHKPDNVSIKATTDFEVSKIQLWGKAHTICPEFFFSQKVEPGASFEWNRSYEFNA